MIGAGKWGSIRGLTQYIESDIIRLLTYVGSISTKQTIAKTDLSIIPKRNL